MFLNKGNEKIFIQKLFLMFGLSEKHTKIGAIFLILSKRPNHEEDFFKFCVLLRKSELYVSTKRKEIYGLLHAT